MNSPSDPSRDAGSSTSIPHVSRIQVLKEPANTRPLSRREQIIVLKAGFLNGVKFPPWQRCPTSNDFELREGEESFLDETSELPLSDFQSDVLDDWKRPRDGLPPPTWTGNGPLDVGPHMNPRHEIDLVQDAATDCSVVASLCACTTRARRGHEDLVARFFYPTDTTSKLPLMSDNGKYVLRLNFNGCFRWVCIDDRIPISKTSRIIHVLDRNNPGLLWPALVEKAYLKVRGGYDFPGSNSGTDLWILTGWIPEQVFLQSDELDMDRLWKRIETAFGFGDVMITIGTGKMSEKTETALGLAGEHDYAVLDLREVDGQRLMLIKNPWVSGTSWSGRFAQDVEETLEKLTLDAGETDETTNLHRSARDVLNSDKQMRPGTFWMDVYSVLQYFESIYLNWNPGLFRHRQDTHFDWDLSYRALAGDEIQEQGPNTNLRRNPQFSLTAQKGGMVWILLWRHFQNTIPDNATPEEIENGRQEIDLQGHIAIVSFAQGGRRVILAEQYLQKGWFVDSPQTLLKLDNAVANQPYTIVPVEQNLRSTNHTFTISAFSNSPLTLKEAIPRYQHSDSYSSEWTSGTSGGNAQHATYGFNPQFSIHISQPTRLSLLLESDNPQYPVNVRLVHSNRGQRMLRIRNRDIILDSKEYRAGCCLAETNETTETVDPGRYTIICSTFEPNQRATFTLVVSSSHPVTTIQLPRDHAGQCRRPAPPALFTTNTTRLAIPLKPIFGIKFYAHAQPHASSPISPSSHIRLAVHRSYNPVPRVVSNDNEFEDSAGGMGIRTPPMPISQHDLPPPHKYWVVLERLCVPAPPPPLQAATDRREGSRGASAAVQAEGEESPEHFVVDLWVDRPDALEFAGGWQEWEPSDVPDNIIVGALVGR